MAVEMLTYAALFGERLNCCRKLPALWSSGLRFRVLVSVDLSEINHKPMPVRSPTGDHPVTAILKVRVEASQAELAGAGVSSGWSQCGF